MRKMSARRLKDYPDQEYRELVDETRVAPPFWAAMHKAARKEDIDSGGAYDSRSGKTVCVQTTADGKPHIVGEIDYDVWRAINIWATAEDKPEGHPGFKETSISREPLGEVTPVEMDEGRDEIILKRMAHLSLVSDDEQEESLQSLRNRRLTIESEVEEAGLREAEEKIKVFTSKIIQHSI